MTYLVTFDLTHPIYVRGCASPEEAIARALAVVYLNDCGPLPKECHAECLS